MKKKYIAAVTFNSVYSMRREIDWVTSGVGLSAKCVTPDSRDGYPIFLLSRVRLPIGNSYLRYISRLLCTKGKRRVQSHSCFPRRTKGNRLAESATRFVLTALWMIAVFQSRDSRALYQLFCGRAGFSRFRCLTSVPFTTRRIGAKIETSGKCVA